MSSKLERLLEKEAQLKAQIQQAKAAERTLEKKRDTRRKILIGAAVLARVQNGQWPESDLKMMMDGFLTRPHERELFGLDADDSNGKAQKAAQKTSSSQAEATAKNGAKKPAGSTAQKAAGKTAKTLPEKPVDLDNEFNL